MSFTTVILPNPSLSLPKSPMPYGLATMLDGAKHHILSYVVAMNFRCYGIVVVVLVGAVMDRERTIRK